MTRSFIALLALSMLVSLTSLGCVVHEKEKVKEVKEVDTGGTKTTTIERT